MILESMSFEKFFFDVRNLFSLHFSNDEVEQIMEYVEVLSDANFRCYKANMLVIAERKKNIVNNKLIADMEWVARRVGEYRVSSKARINLFISRLKMFSNPEIYKNLDVIKDNNSSWITDDTVYSIGEMIDRLSIETIKREDFVRNNRPSSMFEASMNLSSRVEKYLRAKLIEIDNKGFYECLQEQRTYNIEGILEELAV